MLVPTLFPFLLAPAHGMVLPTLKMGLPSLVKAFWNHPHRHTQACFYGDSKSS